MRSPRRDLGIVANSVVHSTPCSILIVSSEDLG